ncbi:hypothetical protein TNCV_296241 [Trichonephila clavipes]|nr:hypothetical protein TNCV_296241 [Trichonephila clavipes]
MLLIPWLVLVLITTCVDLLISLYLLIEAFFNPFLAILFAIDFVILSLNNRMKIPEDYLMGLLHLKKHLLVHQCFQMVDSIINPKFLEN